MSRNWAVSGSPSIEFTLTGDFAQLFPEMGNVSCEMSVQQSKRIWQYPKDRFIEYGPEDESWCRFFGIGQEVEVVQKFALENMYLVGHSEGRVEFVERLPGMSTTEAISRGNG